MPEPMPSDLQDASQSKELPPETEEGYRICIDCTPEGYEVSGPLPLPPAPQEEEGETQPEETLPDLTTAIKHVLAIAKENPIGQDAHEQLKAGYESA